MKWQGRRQSSNVSKSKGGGVALGGGGLILALIVFLITGSPRDAIRTGLGTGSQGTNQEYKLSAKEQELYDYSAVVLADTEDAWHEILKDEGIEYREPKLEIFKGQVKSGCGIANSGMGPFYCSRDETLYMDLSFYDSLIKDFGAKEGDFILSYVISHEVGHHVQEVTGIMSQYQELASKMSENERNALTVRLELQADYLAGVVARYQKTRAILIQATWKKPYQQLGLLEMTQSKRKLKVMLDQNLLLTALVKQEFVGIKKVTKLATCHSGIPLMQKVYKL